MTPARDTHTLTFDAERHAYTLDGASVPSVTKITELADAPALLEVIKAIGPAEFERRRQRGAEFGSAIHAAAAAIARDVPLMPLQISERFTASVEMLGNWIADEVVEVLYCEEIMASPRLRVAGKPDLVAILRKRRRPVIVDYKSGAHIWAGARFQLAAYRRIVDHWLGLESCSRLIIHMPAPEEGEAPTLKPIPLRGHGLDEAGFNGCLQVSRSLQEIAA